MYLTMKRTEMLGNPRKSKIDVMHILNLICHSLGGCGIGGGGGGESLF